MCLVLMNVQVVSLSVRQHSSTIGALCMMGHNRMVMIPVTMIIVAVWRILLVIAECQIPMPGSWCSGGPLVFWGTGPPAHMGIPPPPPFLRKHCLVQARDPVCPSFS